MLIRFDPWSYLVCTSLLVSITPPPQAGSFYLSGYLQSPEFRKRARPPSQTTFSKNPSLSRPFAFTRLCFPTVLPVLACFLLGFKFSNDEPWVRSSCDGSQSKLQPPILLRASRNSTRQHMNTSYSVLDVLEVVPAIPFACGESCKGTASIRVRVETGPGTDLQTCKCS